MSDEKKPTRKPLSHGRGSGRAGMSGTVVVQKKKRHLVGAPGAKPAAASVAPSAAPKPKMDEIAEAARRLGLSKSEYIKRQEAIGKAQAQRKERETKQLAEKEAREERARADREALAEKKEAEKKEAQAAAAEAKHEAHEAQAAQEQQVRQEQHRGADPVKAATSTAPNALETMGGRVKKKRAHVTAHTRGKPQQGNRRRKLTIVSALAGDNERQRSLASMRRAREREKERRIGGSNSKDKVYREVTIPEAITIADLANRMSERTADIVKYLMQQGTMANANEVLDADTAQLIVEDFGHTVKRVAESDLEDDFFEQAPDAEKDMKPRHPVIAIMGHVDHGKTSLLDALRETDIAAGEAGGITQHIGAYQLLLKSGNKITVLDTPGHAAFSAMRTRGAEAVDIVILVVAADDGVKPQTIESIKYAKKAGTPIIVAINKMDTHEANPKRIEEDLLRYEIITESMSGDVQVVEVSAKKKTGLDALAEAITLQAELLELKANPNRVADGVVIESKIVKGRGPVATVLIKRGTIKRGDIIVAGDHWGKVKALTDERGKTLKFSGPSEPVEVMGLDGTPASGEPFAIVKKETEAREITQYRIRKRKKTQAGSGARTMEQILTSLKEKKIDEMPLLVKADVHGSVEAIRSSVEAIGNEDVTARVIHGAVGGINESDVLLAASSKAPIIAFNVRASRQAKALAEKESVEIRYYSIIYELLDDAKGVLEGMLSPEKKETFIGYAEILQVFDISKLGNIGGCKVTEGKVERGAGVRLLRDDVVIHEGTLSTLKRFKEEVKTVTAGMECGMGFEKYHDLKKGDMIECFTVEYLDRKLD
ncbi:MAG: translation initiation factor IF-2 [Robiginitomaculum sp.]